ncbi:potential Mn2+ homeostasis protein [Pseudozyma hubeiensis SY62]|uniref:Potential Mn2+ homeostasis protein n=1 Tax=Pseudozyma hubeiensis (strain SY62) TaxID=1305764 RepID=R9PF16_PSEHS|nr:potential Mn2+ homeostasis protein [Pseudozyma hubeiensis SY62]GAC96690.1 potential Mn2+ homeostasis protein [Pseudozyma hubeiensis SY62]
MPDRASSLRGGTVETARHLLTFIVGSTHVVTFRLLWLAFLFYGERAVFHNAANSCAWPASPSKAWPVQPAVHVLLVTDPQIIDKDTYPDLPLPSLFFPIVRHFSDNYLKNVWTSLAVNPNKWFDRGYILPPDQEALRRSNWRSGLVQPPDGVVWMGDLTDGGRRGGSDAEWAALVHRFHNIFWRPREADWEAPKSTLSTTRQLIVPRASAAEFIPTFYLSGNHDIGLPGTTAGHRVDTSASEDAIERFNRDFGLRIDGGGFVVKDRNPFVRASLNGRILVSTDATLGATHELVLVNAQDLVGMEREGGGPFDTHLSSDHPGKLDGRLGDTAHSAYKETYDFVESVKSGGIRVPRVLLSHVPLHRPPGTTCNDAERSSKHGVYRESSRPLHQGTDRGSTYQNMVSSSVTDWVVSSIDPMAVFSGDDHDHCEYRHTRLESNTSVSNSVDGFRVGEIPELTVKSVSMTEGVRRPGFARLSLLTPPSTSMAQSNAPPYVAMAYTPCLLPDQIGIWTGLYLPFFIATLVGLWLWPRFFHSRRDTQGYLPLNHQRKRDDDDDPPPSSERSYGRSLSGTAASNGWKRDVVAVAIVALPFWVFCQTHFLF